MYGHTQRCLKCIKWGKSCKKKKSYDPIYEKNYISRRIISFLCILKVLEERLITTPQARKER